MTYDAPPSRPAGTNTNAIVSLVLGILSFFGCSCLTGIPAIIFGNMALKDIRATGQEGEGLAKAGLILGWISVGLAVLVILFYAAIILLAVMSEGMS